MDFSISNPEEAKQHLRDWKQRADKLAEDTQAAGTAIQRLTATGSDANETVEISLDANGSMTSVKLSTAAQRQSTRHTERAIIEAYRAAGTQLLDRAREAVSSTLGDESPTGRAMIEGIRQRLPTG
ncbi:YbaB/EbfC family nucleoid-associated protein [Salininema proteolyticum]|uniref:YbaB/EbfC family nucleoid-associated protein n=1 Tax=Salininema proteolyticum TaxID=1607685 RepID=A0ABV8U2K3_9ACTN